jgi:hypothetical protein
MVRGRAEMLVRPEHVTRLPAPHRRWSRRWSRRERGRVPCHRPENVEDSGAQVLTVHVEMAGPGLVPQHPRKERLVGLGGVARLACQHEVVAAVVRGLAPARRHVVERQRASGEGAAAVGAYRAVRVEQPPPRLGVRRAARGNGCLLRVAAGVAGRTAAPSGGRHPWKDRGCAPGGGGGADRLPDHPPANATQETSPLATGPSGILSRTAGRIVLALLRPAYASEETCEPSMI